MPGHMRRGPRHELGRHGDVRYFWGEISEVDHVNNQEQQASDCGDLDQKPGNVNGDILSPWIYGSLYEVHVASCTPPIARFTRFLMSGIL